MSRSRLLSAPRSFHFAAGGNRPVSGFRLGFARVTAAGAAPGDQRVQGAQRDMHYCMDLTDISERRLMITFHNNATLPCTITDIYFSDGDVFSISVQNVKDAESPPAPGCAILADSRDDVGCAPDRYQDSNRYRAVKCVGDATVPEPPHGLRQRESLGIVFDLQAGVALPDVIGALSRGKMTISLKVQGDDPGSGSLYINESTLSLKPI